jgi:hypothetical protein
MKCRYLNSYRLSGLDWSVTSCMANESPYTPSISELQDYCEVKRHAECAMLLKKHSPINTSSCEEEINQF